MNLILLLNFNLPIRMWDSVQRNCWYVRLWDQIQKNIVGKNQHLEREFQNQFLIVRIKSCFACYLYSILSVENTIFRMVFGKFNSNSHWKQNSSLISNDKWLEKLINCIGNFNGNWYINRTAGSHLCDLSTTS